MAVAQYTHGDYIFAWICPLETEQIAALAMLDEQHPPLPQPRTDPNSYILGSIQGHNVVIAGLPVPGNCPAATVITNARRTFQQLRIGLLVGVGGGVPTRTDAGPIKLGHIVVSKPTGKHPGAVQYDHGKAEIGNFRRTGCLPPPPYVLLNAAQKVAAKRTTSRGDPLEKHLLRIDVTRPRLRRYRYPGPNKDHVYEADYAHADRNLSCQDCKCDPTKIVDRSDEEDSDGEDEADYARQRIIVHRGTIATGEQVIRDAILRDQLAKDGDVLCFETEAAGALQDFPCLVVRGISNYTDSHKNDEWHGYAAATAAAYARELFVNMPLYQEVPRQTVESGQSNTRLLYSVSSFSLITMDQTPDLRETISDKRLIVQSIGENENVSWLNPPDRSTNYDYTRRLP